MSDRPEESLGAAPPVRVIAVPQCCLLLLVGPSGCGKSAFAAAHFQPSEVLSSDAYRAIVSDDEEAMDASADAFRLMREVAVVRLRRGLLTVIDATSLRPEDRKTFVDLATQTYAVAVAIVFDVPEQTCAERNRLRAESTPRRTPRRVIARHMRDARGALKSARQEGFVRVHEVGADARESVRIERERLWTDLRHESGGFDIVGDVHGCLDELLALVRRLGYAVEASAGEDRTHHRIGHPEGRRLVGLGDFCDRGPDSPGVLSFWMDAVASGAAFAVRGNHDMTLQRHLRGMKVAMAHGFDRTAQQFALATPAFRTGAKRFVEGLTSHLVLDGGRLAVAHAGVKEEMQGRAGKLVREFCTFGESTGETDEYGLRVRHDWAREYRGRAAVVYGHVATLEAEWVNNTICVDTGCVFGGALTALRWPEREIVSVPAARVYSEPVRPLAPPAAKVPPSGGGTLPEVALLTGKLSIATRHGERPITVPQGQMQAAFETLARHTVDPRWLITLPPTTATVEASSMPGWLERPEEAFEHYARAGVRSVVAQFKHMGSRAQAIVCRHDGTRFGDEARRGIVVSKSGRAFFDDAAEEHFILDAVRRAMDASGLWDELGTDWIALDGEMLPWNAKAGSLIRDTFAATASAGLESTSATRLAYEAAARRGIEGTAALAARAEEHQAAMVRFHAAYRPFVTTYAGARDLRFAPFHVLAVEGRVFTAENPAWHMRVAERLARHSEGVLVPTGWREVELGDKEAVAATLRWFEEITAKGDEGLIVKAPELLPHGTGTAPSIKVRGREYLRIIYGPEYDRPEILAGLKRRNTGRKRTMARVGTVLGQESLARFVDQEPLARVHEVVAASVAIASEPIDNRL